jgi:hypothetical protein
VRYAWLLVLVGVGCVLGGCGSYTKQDFIARADAICTSTVRGTRLIPPPSFTKAGGEQLRALAGYTARVLPLVQAEATELRGLPRPAGGAAADRTTLTGFLGAFTALVGAYRDLELAASRADPPGVARAEAALALNPVAALAARYGLRSCGTAGATYGA